jgi:hypothetical protein
MRISRVFAFVSIFSLIGGCTKTIQQRVGTFYPGAAPTTQPVPKTAVYSIRFVDERGKKTGGIPNSNRLLQAGEPAGFDIDEAKGLVAVAANERIAIDIPAGQGAVWSARYRQPTQFSKEVAKAVVATGKAAKAAAVGAGVVAGAVFMGELESEDDHDYSKDVDPRQQERERRNGH